MKAGNRMCHAITQANCRRDRNRGSESIPTTPFSPTFVRLETFGHFASVGYISTVDSTVAPDAVSRI